MTDYMKSFNSYFSNFPGFNYAVENKHDLSMIKSNKVKVNYSTYILAFISIIVLFVFLSIFNTSMHSSSSDNEGNPLYKLIEIILIAFALVVMTMVIINYMLGINVSAKLTGIENADPEIDIIIENEKKTSPNIIKKKEVFHLPDNIYTYEDAKSVCKAYDADLATIKNIDDAYKSGAEWCSYGWSEKQMALFPTQYSTWNKLQKTGKHKNSCGRPGINGGFVANQGNKYGANCYGYKPTINGLNVDYMNNLTLHPENAEDKLTNKKIQYYKNNINNITISPFNSSSWNA